MDQEIFDYFANEHGISLTETEWQDIQRFVVDNLDMSCDGCRELLGRYCRLGTNHCIRMADDYYKGD